MLEWMIMVLQMEKSPINYVKLFVFPVLISIMISSILGYISFQVTSKSMQDIQFSNGIKMVEMLSKQISENNDSKAYVLSSIDEQLITVGNMVIYQRDMITNDYLADIADIAGITDIFWYNSSGLLINDATGEFVGWQAQAGDPIYNFMISGLNEYREDIRKGTEDDRHYKFVYLRANDGYFVQVGMNVDSFYDLLVKYEYQTILEEFVFEQNEIVYALIVNNNYLAIADTDPWDIGIDYSGDLDYQKAFLGETVPFYWYYSDIEETVLEIATPLYQNGEIIGLTCIGYSLSDYNQTRILLIIIFFSVTIGFSLVYIFFQVFNTVIPIRHLSKEIQGLNVKSTNYIKIVPRYDALEGIYVTLNDMIERISNSNIENIKLNDQILGQANTDYLTNLPNRRAFFENMGNILSNSKNLAMLVINISEFYQDNDNYGIDFGDYLMRSISQKLLDIRNDKIYISKFEGNDFFISYKFDNKKELDKTVRLLKGIFLEPILYNEINILLDVSIGISIFPHDGENFEELLKKADISMNSIRGNKNKAVQFYHEELATKIYDYNAIVKELKFAIKNAGFAIMYQPQIDITTGKIVGLEALIRLKDNKYLPSQFIPVAEETGLIHKIGDMVLNMVIKQISKWYKDEKIKVPTYINLSAYQLDDLDIVKKIVRIVKKHELPERLLGLEITESAMVSKKEQVLEVLMELKKAGFNTAIDDFGSGHAGINYLTKFEVDVVKLDKSFSDKYLNKETFEIFNAVIHLSSLLGFIVLAEGIETIEQVELLKTTVCKRVQGYYYYKPMLSKEIEAILISKE